jgi:hypothetical protein
MDKHLLGLVWGLPSSFALPSVASCRRALANLRLRSIGMPSTDADDHDLHSAFRRPLRGHQR